MADEKILRDFEERQRKLEERQRDVEHRLTTAEHVLWGQDAKEGLRAELRAFVKSTNDSFIELQKTVASLNTFKAKILGGMLLLAFIQPIVIVLLERWLQAPHP